MTPYLSLGTSVTLLVLTVLAVPVLYVWRRAKLFDGLGVADTRLYLDMLLERGYDGAYLFVWHAPSRENVQFRKYILSPTDVGLELLVPRATSADGTRFQAVQAFLARHELHASVEPRVTPGVAEYLAVDLRANTDLGLVLMDAIFHEIMELPRARQFRVRSAGLRQKDERIADAAARPAYAPPSTLPQFEGLVRRLTAEARRHPRRYRVRVASLAIAGYVYVAGVLCVLAASLTAVAARVGAFAGATTTAALAGVAVVIGAMIVRALWIRLPPPPGVPLRRGDAPALFAMVDEVAAALPAPAPRHILLSDEFGAAVTRVLPRLGILGRHQRTLVVGLPLLAALRPEDFRAVLAHELGHFARRHDRLGPWVYAMREQWCWTLALFRSNRGWATLPFSLFFAWYAPFFAAYSFVLARMRELEADALAARLVGSARLACALVAVEAKRRYAGEEFPATLWARVANHAAPPVATCTELVAALRDQPTPERFRHWITAAIGIPTDVADTHPSLGDRLSALGVAPATAPELRPPALANGDSAADRLLGPLAAAKAREWDQAWRDAAAEEWGSRHRALLAAETELAALEETAATRALTVDEAWQQASLVLELRDGDAALPLLEALVREDGRHAQARYALGTRLLDRDREAGVAHLEAAIVADADFLLPACAAIGEFLTRHGRHAEAAGYRERAKGHNPRVQAARFHADTVTDRQVFGRHDLDAPALLRVRAALGRQSRVRTAYLTRKVGAAPLYVLWVVTDRRWFEVGSEGKDARLADALRAELRLPGDVSVLVFDGRVRRCDERTLAAAGPPVFDRAPAPRVQPLPASATA
ncbi:MAG TPA: M48 family metalloprotease [Methylomirabilota bacterium]